MTVAAETMDRASPCPAAVRESEMWLQRQYLAECAARLESLAVSIGEACFRGSNAVAIVHTSQSRLAVISMLEVARTLESLDVGEDAT
jgi:hypothetical protein